MGFSIGKIFEGVENFFGKEDRQNARKYGRLADQESQRGRDLQAEALGIAQERRVAEQQYLDREQSRYDNIYAPIEQRISSELAEGPALEEEAGIAGGRFANEFDASLAARTRDEQRRGINYRAGSSAGRMQSENDAYNRARGIADSATQARRAEDDQHFLRSAGFFNANGSQIQNRLQQGLATMYGADYDARNNAGNQAYASSDRYQGISNQYAEQSKAGFNTLIDVGTRLGAAYMTGGASELVDKGGGIGGRLGVETGAGTGLGEFGFSGIGENLTRSAPKRSANSYGINRVMGPALSFGNGASTGNTSKQRNLYFAGVANPTQTGAAAAGLRRSFMN